MLMGAGGEIIFANDKMKEIKCSALVSSSAGVELVLSECAMSVVIIIGVHLKVFRGKQGSDAMDSNNFFQTLSWKLIS